MFVLTNSVAQAFGGEELGSGSDGDAFDPQVTANHLAIRLDNRGIALHNNMQIEAFLFRIVAQISRGCLPGEIDFIALRQGEGNLHSPAEGG